MTWPIDQQLTDATFTSSYDEICLLNDDVLLVGRPRSNSDDGEARTFRRVAPGSWTHVQTIATPFAANDRFGGKLDVDGNTNRVVIGCADGSPHKFAVYTHDGVGNLSLEDDVYYAEAGAGDIYDLKISDPFVILSYRPSGGSSDEPSYNVFLRTGGTWAHSQTIITPAGYYARRDIALYSPDNIFAIGTDKIGLPNSEGVHIYELSGSTWVLDTYFAMTSYYATGNIRPRYCMGSLIGFMILSNAHSATDYLEAKSIKKVGGAWAWEQEEIACFGFTIGGGIQSAETVKKVMVSEGILEYNGTKWEMGGSIDREGTKAAISPAGDRAAIKKTTVSPNYKVIIYNTDAYEPVAAPVKPPARPEPTTVPERMFRKAFFDVPAQFSGAVNSIFFNGTFLGFGDPDNDKAFALVRHEDGGWQLASWESPDPGVKFGYHVISSLLSSLSIIAPYATVDGRVECGGAYGTRAGPSSVIGTPPAGARQGTAIATSRRADGQYVSLIIVGAPDESGGDGAIYFDATQKISGSGGEQLGTRVTIGWKVAAVSAGNIAIKIYTATFDDTHTWAWAQTLTSVHEFIDLKDDEWLIFGSSAVDQGVVYIYRKVGVTFTLYQEIYGTSHGVYKIGYQAIMDAGKIYISGKNPSDSTDCRVFIYSWMEGAEWVSFGYIPAEAGSVNFGRLLDAESNSIAIVDDNSKIYIYDNWYWGDAGRIDLSDNLYDHWNVRSDGTKIATASYFQDEVHIFKQDQGVWIKEQDLTLDRAAGIDIFGDFFVETENTASIYRFSGGTWSLFSELPGFAEFVDFEYNGDYFITGTWGATPALYVWRNGEWIIEKVLIAGVNQEGASHRAGDGDLVVVGDMYSNNAPAGYYGGAWIWKRIAGVWTLIQSYSGEDFPHVSYQVELGLGVAVKSNWVAIGTANTDIHIFNVDGVTVTHTQTLTLGFASWGATWDLRLDGTDGQRLYCALTNIEYGGDGHVVVFERDASGMYKIKQDVSSKDFFFEESGSNYVTAIGDTIITGDCNIDYYGASNIYNGVLCFSKPSGLSLRGSLVPAINEEDYKFGKSVASSSTVTAGGAPDSNTDVFVFRTHGGAWIQAVCANKRLENGGLRPIPSEDLILVPAGETSFGKSVAAAEEWVAAAGDNKVHLYRFESFVPTVPTSAGGRFGVDPFGVEPFGQGYSTGSTPGSLTYDYFKKDEISLNANDIDFTDDTAEFIVCVD